MKRIIVQMVGLLLAFHVGVVLAISDQLAISANTFNSMGVQAEIEAAAQIASLNQTVTSNESDNISDNWLATAQKQLAEREYFISENEQGLQAPNRQHNLRTYFSQQGIVIETRDREQTKPILSMQYGGLIRKNSPLKARNGFFGKVLMANSLAYKTNKVTLSHENAVEEWFINSAEGVEHGYNLNKRPDGTGQLQLTINVPIGEVVQNANNLIIKLKDGRKLDYKKLKVFDAHQQLLVASMVRLSSHQLQIQFDDSNAVYPIVVDPILTSVADRQLEVNQANANLGISVSGAGDVNGDGYADVIVGANLFDNGETNEGAAFIFHGSANGIRSSFDVQLESNQASANFGFSVSGAGDVNGDGYADVIVGASQFDNGKTNEGTAFVYHGSASGISSSFNTQLEINQTSANFGVSVSGAGDVNGDGYADVIVGADRFDNALNNEGAAFVYLGSANGISLIIHAQLESNQLNAQLGISVSGAGDVNGDGYADVIVGSHLFNNGQAEEGAAFIYHGSASGISTSFSTQLESDQAYAQLGFSVSDAGDVNGDGYADVIVGANLFDNGETGEGAAFIYHGSASGISTSFSTQLESNQADAQLGFSVSNAGDVNGDGYADVIVGAKYFTAGQPFEGAAFIYHGSASGLSSSFSFKLERNQASARFGTSVSGIGDVNGDGYSDVMVGGILFDNGETNEGAAFVYHGSASGVSTSFNVQLESNQTGAELGFSVSGAGDVNGDGYADVIVGAPFFDNGQNNEGAAFIYHGSVGGISASFNTQLESNQINAQFGSSVADAGDVNGDGYADVIVGAPLFNTGQVNEGVAFVYHGSASGISSTISSKLESNQQNAELGTSVAGAGDINGDGYADVIVGAPLFSGSGAAFIYQGSATGISSSRTKLSTNQSLSFFAGSVSTAGDVNGDGYADVIVGAKFFTAGQPSEGAAFIYHGSANGISNSFNTQLESNGDFVYFGTSVSNAGDVNGDGYADVIVGTPYYYSGQLNEGAVFIYHGSANGVRVTRKTLIQSNQTDALLGISVSGAGDVNGDGYADVIIGAYLFDNGGAAFIYHGSARGVKPDFKVQLDSNKASAWFGNSVSGAGDVNGDGFADVIVGANKFSNIENTEGGAFVYFGNSQGRPLLTSQTSTNNVSISDGLMIENLNEFKVFFTVNSPRGRERVKLEIETCALGVAFGGACTSTLTNNWKDTGSDGSIALTKIVRGLIYNTNYHWRVRALYQPFNITKAGITAAVKPQFGPWFRLNADNDVNDIKTRENELAPTLLIDNATLSYTENIVVQIDSTASLIDLNGDSDWDGGTLVVQITQNNKPVDRLFIVDNLVGTINKNVLELRDNATIIGSLNKTAATNGTKYIITFNANATNALVQQVLRAISFNSNSNTPSLLNRTISITATDKNGMSSSDSRIIEVVAVNDFPTGSVTIIGASLETQMLIATNNLADKDGIGSIIYTWKRGDTVISTGNNYLLTVTDVGNRISVEASYIDGQGFSEKIVSNATTIIIAYNANDDFDGDGLSNGDEVIAGTNLNNPDTDGDSVVDGIDAFPLDNSETFDSDNDGVGDNADAFPNDPSETIDTDFDTIGNNADLDDDNDGMPDEYELANGLNPLVNDAGDLNVDNITNYQAYLNGLNTGGFNVIKLSSGKMLVLPN